MIYFALNGHWDSETGGSFTAISKAPYFRALSIWGTQALLTGADRGTPDYLCPASSWNRVELPWFAPPSLAWQ